MGGNSGRKVKSAQSTLVIVLIAVGATTGCEDGGLFGPSTSVTGTWHGTFIFASGTADVTATLAQAEEDKITGNFTATRSSPDTGAADDIDSGSVVGTVGTGQSEWPTATVTFESTKHCHWTLTAVLDDETMAGTWSTAPGCGSPSSGSATLIRS